MIRRLPDTYDDGLIQARPCFRIDGCGRVVSRPHQCPVFGACPLGLLPPQIGTLWAQPDRQAGTDA